VLDHDRSSDLPDGAFQWASRTRRGCLARLRVHVSLPASATRDRIRNIEPAHRSDGRTLRNAVASMFASCGFLCHVVGYGTRSGVAVRILPLTTRRVNETTQTLAEAVATASTGDIWLFRGTAFADLTIRAVTTSPIFHVGVVVVLDDLPPFLSHAELGSSLPDVWTGDRHRHAEEVGDTPSCVLAQRRGLFVAKPSAVGPECGRKALRIWDQGRKGAGPVQGHAPSARQQDADAIRTIGRTVAQAVRL
jgi:hypothetical protein